VFSVASLDNRQNDCVYASHDTRKCSIAAERLPRCRPRAVLRSGKGGGQLPQPSTNPLLNILVIAAVRIVKTYIRRKEALLTPVTNLKFPIGMR